MRREGAPCRDGAASGARVFGPKIRFSYAGSSRFGADSRLLGALGAMVGDFSRVLEG